MPSLIEKESSARKTKIEESRIMDKKYYTSQEVMQALNIKSGNYTTFGRICRKYKLPRIKLGKRLLFPIKHFNKRLEVLNNKLMKNFNI